MKKIFWTTVFWLVVVLGFAFYMKSFDANMANAVGTRLGAINVTSQDTLSTGDNGGIMSGIDAIQVQLDEMQTTLNKLAGEPVPTVDTTPVVPVSGSGATAE